MKKLLGALVALLLVVGGWVLLHKVRGSSDPTPLWTEKDLPALPPEAENGFDVLVKRAEELKGERVADPLSELLKAPTPEALAAQKDAIKTTLEAPGNVKRLFVLDDALAKPHFVDACPLSIEANCPFVPLTWAHDLATLRILSTLADGQVENALVESEKLLRADLEFLGTSRSAIGTMVAIRNAKSGVRVAKFVVDSAPAEMTPSLVEKLGAVAKVLKDSESQPATMERSVVAEYVVFSSGVSKLGENASGVAGKFLYDRKDTVEQLHPYFQAVHAYAKQPGAAPKPEMPRLTEGSTWWLYNPGGKHVVEMAMFDLAGQVEKFEKEKTDLVSAEKALREQIAQVAPE